MKASIHPESRLKVLSIPEGTLFALKCLPSSQIMLSEDHFPGQSELDWSAIYAQFSLEHAVSYLTNPYDRGYEMVSLVGLYTKTNLEVIMIADDRFKSS